MKIGLQIPNFTWRGGPANIGPNLAEIAQTAESAGFYSLWVMDHFFQIGSVGAAEMEMLEGYSALAFCAAVTKTIKLGTLATGVVYRHPGILVKTITTLDVLSGGRAYFGIGASWYEREALGLGVPFPPLGSRFEMLEETLRIAKQMWAGTAGPYQGKHYRLEETLCSPQPLTRPHPPILVAGGGEKKTLRLVAQYGDACNIYGTTDEIARKLAALKGHCETLGRDYGAIEKTAIAPIPLVSGGVSVPETRALCRSLAEVGIDHALFSLPNVNEMALLEAFGTAIIPDVATL